MGLSKQEESEIIDIYITYFDNYVKGDVEGIACLLEDSYTQIGSAESEVFFNKQEALKFIHDTIDQVKNKAEIRNRSIKCKLLEDYVLVIDLWDMFVLDGEDWTFYSKFRASTLMEKIGDQWKFVYQHSSMPDLRVQEGENIAIEKITKENLELRDAVKRRTVELEQKNRELAMEAALERVRAVAMGIRKPDDLPGICEILYRELQQMGIVEIRNAMINIHNDEKSTFINYDYSDEIGKSINHLHYNIHPVIERQIKQIRSSSESFSETVFAGQDLADWKTFRREIGEKDDPRIDNASSLHYYFYSIGTGSIGISTFKEISEEKKELLKRFRNVFDFAYRRYLDVAQAEAQARESQIQLALERVRARTMAMQHSDELKDAASLLFQQVKDLGIEAWTCGYNIWDEDRKSVTAWLSRGIIHPPIKVPITENATLIHFYEAAQRGEPLFVEEVSGEALTELYRFLGKLLVSEGVSDEIRGPGYAPPIYQVNHTAYFTYGYLLFVTYKHYPEAHDIFKRFAVVFEQTYTRFLDLEKAEAQARERQIEAALERVRSRSMGMQKSEELNEVIKTVYQQLTHLKIRLDHAGFVVDYTPGGDWHFWIADERDIPSKITHPYFESVWATQFNKAKEKGEDFFATHLNFEEKNKFYIELLSYVPGLPEASKDFYLSCPGLAASTVLLENVSLYIENFSGIPYTEEENKTLMRFGKVFQQTYARFLDLQKAEAQAREAQIELGLERVRARAMAMRHSEELSELVDTVFKELCKLDFALNWCMINIIDESSMSNTVWAANPDINEAPESYHMLFEDYPFHDAMMKGWKERKTKYLYVLEGEEKRVYDEYLFNDTEFRRVPAAAQAASRAMEKYVVTFTFSNFGGLQTVGEVPLSDASIDILSRFGKVFDLTYTRFNDLQKAEAQAREAQIETALEKVRSRTMAMQNSNELQETAAVLFQEFKKLGTEDIYQVTIGIYNEKDRLIDFRATSWAGDGVQENRTFSLDMNEPTVLQPVVTAWKAKRKSFVIDITGETLERWLNYRNKMTGISVKSADTGGRRVISVAYYSKGHLSISTPVPVPLETMQTLERFAAVFDATYTRFLDLQKAEAQAREAHIEAALERVRSRTLAMQKSDELAETAAVLFQQLIALGIEPNRLYISIIKNEKGDAEFWITDEDGSKVSTAYETNMNDNATFRKMYEGWMQHQKSLVIDIQGEELQHYFSHLMGLGVPFKGGVEQKRRVQDIAYFSKGFIGMASPDEQPAETLQLMERFAAVFNLTFTRFNDLKIAEAHAEQAEKDLIAIKEAKQKAEEALTELQAAQKQLIQSEKMASLGELTAGIAHEIQNPLNFINNFSEVNKELLVEMKEEIDKGNVNDAKEMANDVIENEEKIMHHGKRADAIVKGMLQHSRTNSGQKEPVDINALCDEYFRLAYHGLRAQDKSFNASMKTDFDESIGIINIIPQDIGRVLLNLVNNAFYAVNEKLKSSPQGYEPTVWLQSKRAGDKVEISVRDNGDGIPEKIKEKIFQPFYTTKPTGKGTGLGLSLSYDIVKAHHGDLILESGEGEGTKFTIQLTV